jgi:hypothetical protein
VNAYHVLGIAFTGWALLVAALGILRHRFPERGIEKAIVAISLLLMAATIGAAILTGETHESHSDEPSHEGALVEPR